MVNATKVIVIGHSPGSSKIKRKSNSATLKRLDVWLGACDVYSYSFVNLFAPGFSSDKKLQVDETMIQECIQGYTKVITLGNEVSQYFKKRGMRHYPVPHPSPLNRKFNDKTFEPAVIKGLQSYLNSV